MPVFNEQVEIDGITLVINGNYTESEKGGYMETSEPYDIEIDEVLCEGVNIHLLLDDRILVLIDEKIANNLEL